MERMPSIPRFGSTLPIGMKRSRWSFSAFVVTSPPTPIRPISIPNRSHLVQRDRNRIFRSVQLLRHILEHVLDGEIKLRRGVFELRANKVVRFEVLGRKPDHSIDYADVDRHAHGSG